MGHAWLAHGADIWLAGAASEMKIQCAGKPWGYELLLACTERYAAKILCIRAGQRLSLQHHETKDEVLFLLSGQAELEVGSLDPQRHRMDTQESYRVLPGQRHRLSALTDARVLEVSTPELDDVVRWEDDYGRCATQPGLKDLSPCR